MIACIDPRAVVSMHFLGNLVLIKVVILVSFFKELAELGGSDFDM